MTAKYVDRCQGHGSVGRRPNGDEHEDDILVTVTAT